MATSMVMGHILGLVCECRAVDKRRLLCGLFFGGDQQEHNDTQFPAKENADEEEKAKAKRRQKSLKL